MIVEPVLGEGGYVVPPRRVAARACASAATSTASCSCSTRCSPASGAPAGPFAAETFGVAPDVVLFAKGVASGLPLAGIMAGAELMDRWPNGTHGSTFGGNPVSCAAAVATHRGARGARASTSGPSRSAIGRGATCARSARRAVVEVRGIGAMIGVELADKATRRGGAAALPRRRRASCSPAVPTATCCA